MDGKTDYEPHIVFSNIIYNKIMKKNRKINIIFIISLILYIILAIVLLPQYQYEFETDGISYISIAQKYIEADFSNAINGYWGPLISWLLIPFIFIGIRPVLGFHILNILIGLVSLIGIHAISKKYKISNYLKNVICFVSIPIILSFAMRIFSPDLLVVTILLFYFNIVFNNKYFNKNSNNIIVGFVGAIGYLAKSYLFPFFIVHLFCINIVHFVRNRENRKKIIKSMLVSYIVFFSISGVWISLISNKYDRITFSTTGKFNIALHNPSSNFKYSDFQVQPNETAVMGWEDPSFFNVTNAKIFLPRHIVSNFLKSIKLLEDFTTFSSAIILIALILVATNVIKNKEEKFVLSSSLIAIVVYIGGYCLVHLSYRFLWIINILLLLLGASILETISLKNINKIFRYLIIIIFVGSFLVFPRWNLDKDRLVENKLGISNNKYIYKLSEKISYLNISGRIGSNGEWNKTANLAYYLNKNKNIEYLGISKEMKELKDYKVKYYIYWKNVNKTNMFFNELKNCFSINEIYENSNLIICKII